MAYRKRILEGLVVLALLGGGAVVVDALILTDGERLEAFVDEVSSAPPGERIAVVLDHTDADRVPVSVLESGARRTYGEGQSPELSDRLHRILREVDSESARVVDGAIDFEGARGTAIMRVDVDREKQNLYFEFVKRGDGWLLEGVRVAR
jgi:hypothetical protein